MQFGSLEAVAPVSSELKELGLWQEKGRPKWSTRFPAGHDPDPAIVREIRSFCPDFVPLWVVRTFVTPTEGSKDYGYYALGIHIQNPEETEDDAWDALGPVNVEIPPPFRGGRIYAIEVIANEWKPGSWQFNNNVPPTGEPFDRRALDWMLKTHHRRENTDIVKDQMQAVRDRLAAEKVALDKGREERRLANREDRFQLLRWIGEMFGMAPKATSSTAVAPTPKPKKARPS